MNFENLLLRRRLTEVGAWRVERDELFPARAECTAGGTTVGGFYTQNNIRDWVAFAQELQIEIISETEMPVHPNSSLATYPVLACSSVKGEISVLPGRESFVLTPEKIIPDSFSGTAVV